MRLRVALLLSILFASPGAAHAQTEQVEYYGLDALGSVRVIFDAQGNTVDRMDYGPFGENLRAAIKFPVEQFAQLARDAESGQDYAQARTFAPHLGRFDSVDPIYSDLFDPQAWNRYNYARSNPLGFIDPEGLQFRSGTVGCRDGWQKMDLAQYQAFCTTSGPALWPRTYPGGGRGGGGGGRGGGGQDPGGDPGGNPGGTTGGGGQDPGGDRGGTSGDPNLVSEFVKGCGQGAAGFIDGVVPFADPLQSIGAYDESSAASWWSQPIGGLVRDFAAAELSVGAALGRAANWLATAGRGGSQLAKTISSGNRIARLGQTRMGSGPYTPTLRIGNFQSPAGKFYSHIDLSVGKVWSHKSITPQWVKTAKGCLR